ncbi:MAG: penicillin-binding protein activator [Proteobacteria bacterium]|nr:penicillin-binding protein activator [Pseudomonadota bacterium]
MLFALFFALGGCEQVSRIADEFTLWQGGPPSKPATAPPRKVAPRPTAPVTTAPLSTAPLPTARTPAPPMSTIVEARPLPPVTTSPESVELIPPPGVRDIVHVGLLVPLTGPSAPLGKALLNAAQMALFDIAPDDFALVPQDTGGTPEGAVRAFQEVAAAGATVVLGPLFASSVEAIAPLAGERNINIVAFSNDRSVASEGVFILGFLPEVQVARVVAYARTRGISRFAALLPDTEYGTRVGEAFARAVEASGAVVAQVERYGAVDAKSLSPVIRRLANYDSRRAALMAQRRALEGKEGETAKRALKRLEKLDALGGVDFDAVLVAESGARIRAIAPLLPYYDIDTRRVRVLGAVGWNSPAARAEPALIGAWYPSPSPEEREGFEKIYAEIYGRKPPRLASLAYDATAMAAVLARSKTADPFTTEALTAGNGFSGIDGIFRLLPSGVVERGLAVMEMNARGVRIVSPAPRTFERLTN